MVVFACITTEGYINTPHSPEAKCIFNQNDSACHYAVSIGVIGFLACVAFLLMDIYVPFMSNAQKRKYAVMADLAFSGKPDCQRESSFILSALWKQSSVFVMVTRVTFCCGGFHQFCIVHHPIACFHIIAES